MIAITGATGLLGSHLLYRLVSGGERVIALKRSSSSLSGVREVFSFYSKEPDILFDRVEWRDCELENLVSLTEALQGADKIVHTAAMVSFDPADRKKMVQNNTGITANMVAASFSLNISRFVHISSTAAIGRPPLGEKASEDMIWSGGKGSSGYALSKFRSEMEVWKGIEEGLPAVILNPAIILGPGFWNTGSSALLTRVAKGMKFYTEGSTAYVGVGDVVNAILLALEDRSELLSNRFILASENLSYKEVFEMMASALGKAAPTIKATAFMTGLAWRADWLFGMLPGKKRMLTRETVDSSHSVIYFSNEKARRMLGMDFEPVDTVIKDIAAIYKKKKG